MFYISIAALIVSSVGGVASWLRGAQMLQQNSYFVKRYIGWLKSAFSVKKLFFPFMQFCALTVFFLLNLDILFLIVATIGTAVKIPYAHYKQKTSIKKLVFTARVKRQSALAVILLALAVVLFALTGNYAFGLISILLSSLTPLTVILVRYIAAPMEKCITRYYINDAKKILKNHKNLTVVGITGSYGKTSTKYILYEMLSEKFNCVMTPGSFNTPLGVVRTVRENLRPETEIFIAEMGAKQVGDIKEICDIASPRTGIVTSVGAQHLDTFGSQENVTKTKLELADAVKENGGKIFLNHENEFCRKYEEKYPTVTFGKDGDVTYENVTYSENGVKFSIIYDGGKINITTKLLGAHNVINITAAAALALSLGVSPEDISYAAAKLKAVSHRLELKSFINGAYLLDDAYNANPVGCIEAVNVLSQFKDYKKIIVTPGLVELGEKEYEYNYNLGAAAAKTADEIILVGEKRSIPLKKAAQDEGFSGKLLVVPSFAAALEELKSVADKNTVVLIENDLPDNYSK